MLPQGSPQDVKRAVVDCLAFLAPDDTGLVLAPSHRLMTDVPLENVEALLAAMAAQQSPPYAGGPGNETLGKKADKDEMGQLTTPTKYAILRKRNVIVNGNVNGPKPGRRGGQPTWASWRV